MNPRLSLVLLLALLASIANAAETLSTSITQAESEGASSLQIKPSVGISVGSSSNVGKLNQDSSGTYGRVSPSLSLEYLPSDSVVLNFQINGDVKRYSEDSARTIGDEKNGEARLSGIWFINDTWEFGGDLGGYYSENRLPVQISSTETSAQIQKYTEPDSRLYLAWIGEKLSVETGANAKLRTYSTTVDDRENTFHNDFDSFSGDVKVGYSFAEAFKLSLKVLIEDKQYKERRADFSDGAASNPLSPHPILRETANEFGVVADYQIGKLKLTSTPAVRLNKDRIFGARDSQTLKFQQKIMIPIGAKLSWSPGFTLSQESFERFRSNPEGDPFGSPLRRDLDLKLTSPFKYTLKQNLQVNAEYGFSRKDSNYANSSYSEHTVSAGLTVSM